MSEMLEVVIDSIRVSLMNQQRIVILREAEAERYLAIWIGVYEAEHLTMALQDVNVSRPLTYDLFLNVIESLGAQIIRVEVAALRDETFYGNVVLEIDGELVDVDARPSDAMNLAVRCHAPIYVSRQVMATAGIVPGEDDVSIDDVPESTAPLEEGSERLSVFEDFLENLDDEEDEGDEEDE